MKISLIAAPFVEIPPTKYGGAERILEYLGHELIKKGVDLTLYTTGDSKTNLPTKTICDTALFNDSSYNHTTDRETRIREINKKTLSLIDPDTDIINCHDYDNPDLVERLSKLNIPILVSIRHAINPAIREIYDRFSTSPNMYFHGLTKNHSNSIDPSLHYIHNGVDEQEFETLKPEEQRAKYFLSLGDTKPIKGHKTAIKLAKRSSLALVIAGAPYYPESIPYFKREIKPHITRDVSKDQESFLREIKTSPQGINPGEIIYFGTATTQQKKDLYKFAKFMQFLGSLEVIGNIEACPLTPIEAMMSGTPVIGVKGSVTDEMVTDNLTGFNVSSLEDALLKVEEIENLAPTTIREQTIRKFSSRMMAQKYLEKYKKILGESNE